LPVFAKASSPLQAISVVAVRTKNQIRLFLVIMWVKSVSPIQIKTTSQTTVQSALALLPLELSCAEGTKKFDAVCGAVSLK
jgi:hypothetical protein